MPTEKKGTSKTTASKASSTATATKSAAAEKKTTTKTAEKAVETTATTSTKTNPAPAPAKAEAQTLDFTPAYEAIAERAFLIWAERGYTHGNDVQDWLRAEAELRTLVRK